MGPRASTFGVAIWLVTGVSTAAGQTAAPLTLAELEQRALARNPTLVQADARVSAETERAMQAGRWSNPSMGYTAEEVSNSETIRGGEHGVFFEQVIPTSGRLGASRTVFERRAAEAAAEREAQRQRVVNDVRTTYYEVLIATRRVEVRQDLARLAEEAVGVSRRLANVGAADRPDLLAAEIEAERARLAAVEATYVERRAWQRLTQVVGDPELEPQPLAGDPEQGVPEIEYETVLASLLRDSVELRAARAGMRRAEAQVDRAQVEVKPDIIVRAGPRYNRELLDPGPTPVGLEFFVDVGVSVPLWNRNRGGIAAAGAELREATAEAARVELELRDRLSVVFERYATSSARLRSYRDVIIPRAAESHQLFLDRYQEMAAAYPQVLIAQRTLFEVTEEYLDVLGECWRSAILLDGQLLTDGLAPPGGALEP